VQRKNARVPRMDEGSVDIEKEKTLQKNCGLRILDCGMTPRAQRLYQNLKSEI
jgi:hypothetical protein